MRPVFKRDGEVFTEITEYPSEILEPLSYGQDNKE